MPGAEAIFRKTSHCLGLDLRERLLSTRWGSVEEHIQPVGDGIRSVVTLEVLATRVDPADYPEFARFCRAIDELLGRPPIITRTR